MKSSNQLWEFRDYLISKPNSDKNLISPFTKTT